MPLEPFVSAAQAGGDYFRSGYYSHGVFVSTATTTIALNLSLVVYRPFLVPARRAFDRIGCNVTVAAAAGGVLRFGIYTDIGGQPGALVTGSEGTVASTSTGGKEIVIAVTLEPGLYWIATVPQTATCTATAYSSVLATPYLAVSTTPVTSTPAFVMSQGSVTGALPATATPAVSSTTPPATCLRAA